MTNQERAEKIGEWFKAHSFASEKEGLDFITSQLDEAVREARESVLNEQKCNGCGCSHERCCCNPIREMKAREEGFATAKEKAAGIADEYEGDHFLRIAERIRVMEP